MIYLSKRSDYFLYMLNNQRSCFNELPSGKRWMAIFNSYVTVITRGYRIGLQHVSTIRLVMQDFKRPSKVGLSQAWLAEWFCWSPFPRMINRYWQLLITIKKNLHQRVTILKNSTHEASGAKSRLGSIFSGDQLTHRGMWLDVLVKYMCDLCSCHLISCSGALQVMVLMSFHIYIYIYMYISCHFLYSN